VTDAQVRKDLAALGTLGHPGVGYLTHELTAAIRRALGVDREWAVALVGVGNLGHALAGYGGFASRGFRMAALLDAEPEAANAFAADGFTPLALAAFFAQPAAVRLLVGRGADVGAAARNAMAVQPLHAAVAGRDFASASVLLGAGADPNARQHGGWTPLMAAAAHGDREIVEVLLSAGADPEIANDEGKTAAFLAEEGGHSALAQHLRGLSLRP
jgi:ankyrin repeat protein